jgi:transposase-like protein
MIRQQQVYSEAFRRRMVERMSGSRALSATALSSEVSVSQATLSRWLREASKVDEVSSKKPRASRGRGRRRRSERSGEEKVRIVMEAAGLAESER